MATDKPRYTVSVDDEMFQQIEDFRFKNRYQTRSEATVELIRRGLEVIELERTAAQPIARITYAARAKPGHAQLPVASVDISPEALREGLNLLPEGDDPVD